jgi:hypothetical protein
VCSQHDDTRGGGPRGVHAKWFRDDKSGEGAEEHHEREPGPVRRGLEYGVLAPAGQVCREEKPHDQVLRRDDGQPWQRHQARELGERETAAGKGQHVGQVRHR